MLTDYLEFRWYVGGERRLAARLELQSNAAAIASVAELLTHFLAAAAPMIATPRELALRLVAARARLFTAHCHARPGTHFGFELLMAPYTVAHFKLGLLLRETGYDFAGDEWLRVYLTNTLE